MTLHIDLIPVLQDNYAYLLYDESICAVVDPGDAAPVLEALSARGLQLDYILNTHHHYDHTDGNAALIDATGAKLIGPHREKARIAAMDIMLEDGDAFSLGAHRFTALATPGHTHGHLCYYFAQAKALFSGDTLFSLGCGRLFEGTAEEMFDSLQKLKALPDETRVYCGHEYTLANAEFSRAHNPDNPALDARLSEVAALRAQGKPSLPVLLKTEKETNVFLRAPSADAFAHLRSLKDQA